MNNLPWSGLSDPRSGHELKEREKKLIILQKYFLREWVWAFLAVTIVLTLVMIGVALGELLGDIAGGRLPSGLMGVLLILKVPDLLNTVVPLAVFIAIIWGLGRMYRDQEMAVMRASGFNWRMLLRPLFNLLLPVAVVMLAIGLFMAPKAASFSQDRLEEAFRTATEWGLQTGKFHVLQGGNLVLYVESVGKFGHRLKNIFIQQRQDGREQVWVAEQGYYWLDEKTGERYLTLENGQITEGGETTLDFGILQFSRNDLKLPQPELRNKTVSLQARKSLDMLYSSDPEEVAELQWRLASAISVIVLGFLAIPLSHSAPKEGRGGRVVLGILAYATYANFLYMCKSWVASGDLTPWIGMWWIHLLTLIAALAWLRQQGRMLAKGH